jgi:hypothetical protein
MSTLATLRPSPLFMLRPSARMTRCFAVVLAGLAAFFALLVTSRDPEGCHPEKHNSPAWAQVIITSPTSPTAASILDHCPGGPQYGTGDFKFR